MRIVRFSFCLFFFNDTPTTGIYTLSLHAALPISVLAAIHRGWQCVGVRRGYAGLLGEDRSEEHTSELQSRGHLVCRLLLEKKNVKRRHGQPAGNDARPGCSPPPAGGAPPPTARQG